MRWARQWHRQRRNPLYSDPFNQNSLSQGC